MPMVVLVVTMMAVGVTVIMVVMRMVVVIMGMPMIMIVIMPVVMMVIVGLRWVALGLHIGAAFGIERRLERQPVTRRSGGDRGGIGDARLQGKLTQRLAIPSGASRDDKGGALRRGLQSAFGGTGERDGELVRLCEGFPIFGRGCAKAIREQESVGARGAEGQEIDQPAAERAGVLDLTALHRPF